MRLRLRHAPVVAFLLALAPAPSAQADPVICTYVEERSILGAIFSSGSPTGHAFTQLRPDTGVDAGRRDLVWGFSPQYAALAVTGGPGKISSNADHAWHWKVCNTVSHDAYNRAAGLVANDIKNVPRYSLGGFNCTDWAYKIARGAGIELPSASLLTIGKRETVLDPDALADHLRDIYNRGRRSVAGGRLYRNDNKVQPRNDNRFKRRPPVAALAHARPAPRAGARPAQRGRVRQRGELEGTESLLDMIDFAFHDPSGTARGLDLRARRRSLPRVRVGAGQPLRLSLGGISPLRSVTEVRFGDGERARMGTGFTHSYARPGRYDVRGIAIASTVFKFRLTVDVDQSSRAADVRTTVPRGRPRHDGLPRSKPPIAPCAGARGRQRRFNQVIRGSAGADTLTGTPGSDVIIAGAGDDRIRSLGGNDLVFAGGGDDDVSLGAGNDRAHGAAGADVVNGGSGLDRLGGGLGRDRLRGGPGDDAINSNSSADRVAGGAGCDQLAGGSGPDLLSGAGARDRIFGAAGGDLIGGGLGSDHLDGGPGADRIFGRSGWDRLFGDDGGDLLFGGSGRDRIRGGSGPDRLRGGRGDDSLDGGRGSDRTTGN